MSHRRRRRTVQSYSPGCTNVPSTDGTLAPPGEYDWTYDFFGPPESTTQRANWLVQPFFHSSRRKVSILYNGPPLPLKISSCHWGIWTPSNIWFPEPTWVLNPNDISICSAVFAGLTSVTDRQTDRQTDHATRSVTIGRIYVRNTAMRPNNNNIFI